MFGKKKQKKKPEGPFQKLMKCDDYNHIDRIFEINGWTLEKTSKDMYILEMDGVTEKLSKEEAKNKCRELAYKYSAEETVIQFDSGRYLHLQVGYFGFTLPDCDAYIDYTYFDENKDEIDGGQYDYNTGNENYDTIYDAIEQIMDFGGVEEEPYRVTEMTLDELFE